MTDVKYLDNTIRRPAKLNHERSADGAWLDAVSAWLKALGHERYFGQVILIFENGKPVAFKKQQTLKLEDLPG